MKKMISLIALALFGVACASQPVPAPAPTAEYKETVPGYVPSEPGRDPAQATLEYIREGQSAPLKSCGGNDGKATLFRSGRDGKLYVRVENIECASWTSKKIGYRIEKLDRDRDGDHGSLIPVDESDSGWHELVVGSKNFINLYKDSLPTGNTKGDIVRFYIPARKVMLDLYFKQKAAPQPLPSCGGNVRAQINADRSVSVIFDDVQRCNVVDFVEANGDRSVDFGPYQLQDRRDGLGGSYTISKKLVDVGTNGITMRVMRVGSGEDRIHLRFFGL